MKTLHLTVDDATSQTRLWASRDAALSAPSPTERYVPIDLSEAQAGRLSHPPRTADAVPQDIPAVIVNSIWRSFPNEAKRILVTLHWSNLNECFFFERWETYIGIERDGYIHS